tara:strand:- start:802 stop:1194 length:393 start_codon:yes stop_codon:yes gene_type:complete
MTPMGYIYLLPALFVSGMMLGAFAMVLSSLIKQLENFAGIMNFVIFPMFFLSSALYPLWKMKENSIIVFQLCTFNPFTYAIELIRFSLYEQFNGEAVAYTSAALILFLTMAIYAYDPARGMMSRKGGPDG